ncbi:MAG: FHA domain-containing protein [Fusobacteriaceae bacterium]|jgi:hypothetical protein|nr:FHA domain-containing protein [Fusobacteriaceae bacterium]
MAKTKTCPQCGLQNLANIFTCKGCGYDLTGVSIDKPAPSEFPSVPTEPKISETQIRICEECQHKNPANLLKCEACGESLEDVPITSIDNIPDNFEEDPLTTEYSLISLEDGEILELDLANPVVIGRANVWGGYLVRKNKDGVSRKHCKFSLQNGQLVVTDLKSKNGTIVNGKSIPSEKAYPLQIGSIVMMGGERKPSRSLIVKVALGKEGEKKKSKS